MLVLITRPKFSEDSSCENTPCKRSILAKSLIFIQDCFSYAFYFWPSLPRTKKQKKRLISDYPSRFDFIQAGQTLEISFPFPPLIFLLSLAWTSGPARWSINERLLCLLFALSSFRIKLLSSANSSNAVSQRFHRKPSVFWSPWQSNVLTWLLSLSSMFLANFLSRWLLGVFFYPRRQCCDRSRR